MVRQAFVAITLVLALGLSPALAAGDPPTFSVETLAPKADDMKDGWSLVDGAATPDEPCEGSLMAIATGVGLDDLAFYVEGRRLKTPAGATVAVAWVDIDTDPTTVRKAIDQAAGEKGWAVRELSTPYRLLVVGGSGVAQESTLRHQQEHVIRRFVTMAETRLEAKARHADDMREAEAAARNFLERGRAVGIDAAALDVLDAFLHWRAWTVANGEKASHEAKLKKDAGDAAAKDGAAKAKATADAEQKIFLELASKGFDPKRAVQPIGWLPVSVAGRAGGMLLEKKDASLLAEAVRLLDAAVAVEGRSPNADLAYANRYNLACAHARLGHLDKAFEYLEGALELGATRPPFAFGNDFVHLRDKDEDLAPLRKDERWDPLIEKYHSDGIKKYEEFVKKQAERNKGRSNPHGDDADKPSDDEPPSDGDGDGDEAPSDDGSDE